MNEKKRLIDRFGNAYVEEILNPNLKKLLVLETFRGPIYIELFHKDVPLVTKIIEKALLDEYDGMTFYNCNDYFVQLRKSIEEKEFVPTEINPKLKNIKGTVGIIKSKKEPGLSVLDHFYITLREIPELDNEYVVIGRVVKGLDVLSKIWDGNTVRRAHIEAGSIKQIKIGWLLNLLFLLGLFCVFFYFYKMLSLQYAAIRVRAIQEMDTKLPNILGITGMAAMFLANLVALLMNKYFDRKTKIVKPKKRKILTKEQIEIKMEALRAGKMPPKELLTKEELKVYKARIKAQEKERKEQERKLLEIKKLEERRKLEEAKRIEEAKKKAQEEERKKLEEIKREKEEATRRDVEKKAEEERARQIKEHEEIKAKKVEEDRKLEEFNLEQERIRKLEEERLIKQREKEKKLQEEKRLEEIQKLRKIEQQREKLLQKELLSKKELERKQLEKELKRRELEEKRLLEKELAEKKRREKEKEEEIKEEIKKKKWALEEEERKKQVEKIQAPARAEKAKQISKEEIKKEFLPRISKKTETQLDILYDMLEKYQTLKLGLITETFNVDKNEALEWCNVLVEYGLAEITYPAFGDPILKIKEKK